MSAEPSNKALHLPSLSIKGFRGIKELSIPSLGRVTLFVGKNGVGKTTLLDAVRVFAARGRYSVLADILRQHDELTDAIDEDGDEMFVPNWEALFHGWHSSPDEPISIGLVGLEGETSPLCIRTVPISKRNLAQFLDDEKIIPEYFLDDDVKAIQIEFQGAKQEMPIGNLGVRIPFRFMRRIWRNDETQLLSEILCESLGPSLLSNADVARFWDKVALTEDETRALEALNLLFGDIDRAAVVGTSKETPLPFPPYGRHGRRAVVKLKGQERPVPLKSLGDGAVRLFGVALALANSQGGFLVIDEAENGIHYLMQRDFWRMVLKTAYANNVQVLATTHSWDCAAGFAQAAVDVEEVKGMLIRLEEDGDQMRVVEYSEDALKIAAERGIEVR